MNPPVSPMFILKSIKRNVSWILDKHVQVNDLATNYNVHNMIENYMLDLQWAKGIDDYQINSKGLLDDLSGDFSISIWVRLRGASRFSKIPSGMTTKKLDNAPISDQLKGWVAARRVGLHSEAEQVGQPLPHRQGWQPSNSDREVPPVDPLES